MVSLDPDHLNPASGRRQLLHIREQTPVIGMEFGEVQIIKDIAEQDETVERRVLERSEERIRSTHSGP